MDLEAADVAHEETPPSYDQNYEQTPITAGTEINIHSGGGGAPLKHTNTAIVPIQDKTLYNKDQKINGLMKQLSSYTSVQGSHDDHEKLKNKERAPVGLGTLAGVYFPTIQNIYGVILFIRLPWIVGLAGIWQALAIVGFCCCTTMLTAISMSAIATNGKIPAGGSYFMISRSLGPGLGGAVGLQFYIATAVASAMYILGAVEILTVYIAPNLSLGSTETNARIYGTVFLIIMCFTVFVGVAMVNKSASAFLTITLVAILSIFIGFVHSSSGPNHNSIMCMYGDILVDRPVDGLCNKYAFDDDGVETSEPSELFQAMCDSKYTGDGKKGDEELTESNWATYISNCETEIPYLAQAKTWYRWGAPGLGAISENWNLKSHWKDVNEPIRIPELRENPEATKNYATCDNFVKVNITSPTGNDVPQWYCGENNDKWIYMTGQDLEDLKNSLLALGDSFPWSDNTANALDYKGVSDYKKFDWVVADLTSTSLIMIGIFFPSVTGIMAGSNRSGDLADAPKSIPIGTICAILTTSISYLLCVVFFGLCIDGALLRDKFGESISLERNNGGTLLTGLLCEWVHPWVMLIGAFLSTCGAGLQSLTGAPRLLQSIAKDDLIPGKFFAKLASGRGEGNEPTWAVLVTFSISFGAIMIANLDLVAPILTIFFLMCYLFVNVSTALCSLIKAPSWRPSFKYYHWSLSLLGAANCLILMFLTDLLYPWVSFMIAACVMYAIARYGGIKEWGDSLKGLHMTIALSSLKRYGKNVSKHTKNWRPQILLLNKLDEDTNEMKYPGLLTFVNALKEGKGLLIMKTFIENDYEQIRSTGTLDAIQEQLDETVKAREIHTIDNSIIVSSDIANDIPIVLQTVGIAGLRPNTICLNFPSTSKSRSNYDFFYKVMRHAAMSEHSVLVTKNITNFPKSDKDGDAFSGTVDIWWVRQDGGMMLLIAHLLLRSRCWKDCTLRMFVTSEPSDNSIEMKSNLEEYLAQMRITGEVIIVEIAEEDAEPFITERNLVANIYKGNKPQAKDVDHVMNKARKSVMPNSTTPKVTNIPDSFSGTWSNSNTDFAPRSTILKKMHEAGGLNKKIIDHSAQADLVLVNLPPIPTEHNSEKESNYMKYVDALTRNLQRVVLVRSSGNEVITMFN